MSLPPPPSPTAPPTPSRDGWWNGLSHAGRAVVLTFVAAAGLAMLAWQRCGLFGCPNVDGLTSYQPGRAPVLLDRNGKAFANLAPVEGETVPLRSLPKHVPQAFLAVEDRRFYEHHGIDWRRVPGAALANLRSGGYDEGFSTLSMQLARNVFPDRIRARERTPWRKLLEVRVALEIEQKYTKDEILELYLNHIYFGHGARGIAAAARHYFGVPPSRLGLSQAALLAALPKGPSIYDPRRHPKQARERRNLVLALMQEQRRLTPAQAAAARQQPLGVVRRRSSPGTPRPFAAYFVEEVRRDLEERFGEGLYDETLRLHTTLDVVAQKAAEEELERQFRAVESGALGRFRWPRYSSAAVPTDNGTAYLQGAVVALEVRTGDVLAWVGGRDFRHSRFDRVKGGRRQAGSAFKPFVYATALASGRTLSQQVLDEPLRVSLGGRRWWEPKNFDGSYDGQVSVREALVRSKNVATIRLADSMGYEAVARMAERLGLDGPISTRPSMALGTVSVSPLELTGAYTAFASLGEAVPPRLVRRVEGPDGELLWEAELAEREQVLEPGVAFLITDALRDALERGTATTVRAMGFRGPAAGKTGTTNDATDTWFVGYTPEVVAAVWIGFDQPRPIMAVATGGRVAAPVWARMMIRYQARRSLPAPWRPPSGVFQATVDPATGLLLAEGCQPVSGPAYREYFLRGMSPPSVCPYRGVPYERVAELELPPADDEEATVLDIQLPPELREPLPSVSEEADAAEAAEEQPVELEPGRPAPEEPVETPRPRRAEEAPAEKDVERPPADAPAGEPTPAPTPVPRLPSRPPTPAATPVPAPTPAPPPEPLP